MYKLILIVDLRVVQLGTSREQYSISSIKHGHRDTILLRSEFDEGLPRYNHFLNLSLEFLKFALDVLETVLSRLLSPRRLTVIVKYSLFKG